MPATSSNHYDIAVIGGGNLGLWTAHELARRSAGRIAVLERGWAGWGATSRSAGMVRAQGGAVAAIVLGRITQELYRRVGEEIGLDSGFTANGYYVLAADAADAAAFQGLVALRQRHGVASEWVDPGDGQRRFPALDWSRYAGATYAAADGYVHPPIAARNITLAVHRDAAVDLFEMAEVSGIDPAGNGFRLATARGEFHADRVVNAGGPRGCAALGALVGLDIPSHAARHQVVTFGDATLGDPGRFPMAFAVAAGIYVRPEEHGTMLGMSNPAETADRTAPYQLAYDWAYHERIRPLWEADFPALAGCPISRAWAASIDYTPDHLPIIDEPRPGFFVLAAGGHGMMCGPALGAKMAELMTEGTLTELPDEEVRLARFRAAPAPGRVDAIALPFPTA